MTRTMRKGLPALTMLAILGFTAGCGANSNSTPVETPSANSMSAQPTSAITPFGAVHSSWQVQVQPWSRVSIADGLVLVFEPDSSSDATGLGTLTAHQESTGAEVWSLHDVQFPSVPDPQASGSEPILVETGSPGDGSCPQSLERVSPANGGTLWTTQISGDIANPTKACSNGISYYPVSDNDAYVVVGHTVLASANGVTLSTLPGSSANAQAAVFGNSIIAFGGREIELYTMQHGSLQVLWHRATALVTDIPVGEYPDLWLQDTENQDSKPEILNPATGAVTGYLDTGYYDLREALPTPGGITGISSSGHFLLMSANGTVAKTGPKVVSYDGQDYFDTTLYTGGVIWQGAVLGTASSLNNSEVVVATAPGSFQTLGSLLVNISSYDGGGSADGSSGFASDGQYAVVLAEPWVYAFHL